MTQTRTAATNSTYPNGGVSCSNDSFVLAESSVLRKVDYLKTDRVIRCIIFLAKGSLTELNKYMETATYDTRDVMLWAEYDRLNEKENPRRVRDFNKTFSESSNDVKE